MKYPTAYTIARWRVTIGQEEAFRAAWHELAEVFSRLGHPPLDGTLLQHHSDATLFVSFGPWSSPDDIAAMRRDPAIQDAFLRVTALCDENDWGCFTVVERVDLRAEADVTAIAENGEPAPHVPRECLTGFEPRT